MRDNLKEIGIGSEKFSELMHPLNTILHIEKKIAVAVSGGADSLGLAILLSGWIKGKNIKLHALTVDHDLRVESSIEAKLVAKILKPFGLTHKILKWEGKKPTTKIQEAARNARYALMTEYCLTHKINFLCVAHHGQDQMETILFRLAKGTGLDGASGMRSVQTFENGLTLLRPLLSVSHQDLCNTCIEHGVQWIEDPSNVNNKYARIRIRQVLDTLQREGLTPQRIESFSHRVTSSLELIDFFIDKTYQDILVNKDIHKIEINFTKFLLIPLDGQVRILKMIIAELKPHKKYPARLEDIERLARSMKIEFKGKTLGGCHFKIKKKNLSISLEKLKSKS